MTSYFFLLINQGLVFWKGLLSPFVSQNPRKFSTDSSLCLNNFSAWSYFFIDNPSDLQWKEKFNIKALDLRLDWSFKIPLQDPIDTWKLLAQSAPLHRGKTSPQTSVLIMTLNNLMMRFQKFWNYGECGISHHCHCSQVYSSLGR